MESDTGNRFHPGNFPEGFVIGIPVEAIAEEAEDKLPIRGICDDCGTTVGLDEDAHPGKKAKCQGCYSESQGKKEDRMLDKPPTPPSPEEEEE